MYKKKKFEVMHASVVTNALSRSPVTRADRLEGRVGVGKELLEVGLEPLAGLGGRLQGIRPAAVEVVASRGGVASAIALTAGLDPDKGIEQVMARVGRRASTEAGANGIAPVTPLGLSCMLLVSEYLGKEAGREHTSGLLAAAASVGNEVSGEAGRGEERAKGLNVVLLIVVGVGRRVRRGRGDAPGVVVGNVGGQATDSSRLAGVLVDAGKQVSGGLDVGGPAEPASVASVEVHGHVRQVQLLERIHGQLLVCRGGAAALLDAHVGHHVGKGVRLNDQEHANVRVLDDHLADTVNVALVVGRAAVCDRPLAVGRSRSTVTVGEVVDDQLGLSSVSRTDLTTR